MPSVEQLRLRAVHAVAKRRDNWVVRKAARGSEIFLNLYENFSYEPAMNGESRIIEAFVGSRACVFDVGANVGDWTAEVLSRLPDAEVHCFEVVPATGEQLLARYRGSTRVHVNAYGLAAQDGEIPIRYYPGFSAGSSATGYDHGLPSEWIACHVRRGDDYCAESGIDRIDLLKVDAEGADLEVLRGFERMFAEGRVRLAQFEYGRANIISHALLHDFARFFEEHGYALGKVYPAGVEFRPYDFSHEDFRGPNFVAVAKTEPALQAVLAGRSSTVPAGGR